MAHENIAHRISPEYPKFTDTESQIGNEYRYTGEAALIEANKPESGDTWEDGRTVTEVKMTPSLGNSGWHELFVSTLYARTATKAENDNLPIEIRYRLTGQVSQVELAQHPDFMPGGPSDLYTTPITSGTLTARPVVFCMLWENEPSAEARAQGKFYRRDADGNAIDTTPILVPAGGARTYVQLRLLSFTTKDVYNPVWEKIGIYRGDQPPSSGTWGQYIASSDPLLAKVPTATKTQYPQWIKSGDDVERVGNKARWSRTERATGYVVVYFDVDDINPAGNTLPPLV